MTWARSWEGVMRDAYFSNRALSRSKGNRFEEREKDGRIIFRLFP
jgi:hypothetical protein